MKRSQFLAALDSDRKWDFIVIGGGATGLAIAVDAVSRGFRTILFEGKDFCAGTSSKSTKLIHGGVRYLEQGNLTLVVDALRERRLLLDNAPTIVRPLRLVIPCYQALDVLYYGLGLKFYDLLALRRGMVRSRCLSREQVLEGIPTLCPERLKGGVEFSDAQFDDTRLGISMAKTAANHGATLLNYCRVDNLLKQRGRASGVVVTELLENCEYEVLGKVVINATGVLSDQIRRLDDKDASSKVVASQGSHVVLDGRFLPGNRAILVPKTEDGRVLFAIPWFGKTLAGTTDLPVDRPTLEPRPEREEIYFILKHLGKYLVEKPEIDDVKSVFAGLRPLLRSTATRNTSSLSRDHTIEVSRSGMVSIMGGKWTTARKMAEDVLNVSLKVGHFAWRESQTRELPLDQSETAQAQKILNERPELDRRLVADLPYREAEVVLAVREEMACNIEDVLARRTRLLSLDAGAAVEIAPTVAKLMAEELGFGEDWERGQLKDFRSFAKNYLL
jgi:glycerol-3-phosphate dehydrogenase